MPFILKLEEYQTKHGTALRYSGLGSTPVHQDSNGDWVTLQGNAVRPGTPIYQDDPIHSEHGATLIVKLPGESEYWPDSIVGHQFRGPFGTYLCESYDPHAGFWMTRSPEHF